MSTERTYSTREVSQMWNVSESTVKRWADDFGLRCYRTPGGHRRFRLEDIYEFQQKRAFEATGILTTEEWEDPELELWVNSRNFAKVCELLLYLASQNQRTKVKLLLERLYLRGMRLEEIYDEILVPLDRMSGASIREGELSSGHALLVGNNLEEAIYTLSPKMIRRRPNGKTALCAAVTEGARLPVRVLSQILEIEGWDSLCLGERVPYEIMSEVVETEPVNLVCIFADSENQASKGSEGLIKAAHSYRIPVVLTTASRTGREWWDELLLDAHFSNFRSFRSYVVRLAG